MPSLVPQYKPSSPPIWVLSKSPRPAKVISTSVPKVSPIVGIALKNIDGTSPLINVSVAPEKIRLLPEVKRGEPGTELPVMLAGEVMKLEVPSVSAKKKKFPLAVGTGPPSVLDPDIVITSSSSVKLSTEKLKVAVAVEAASRKLQVMATEARFLFIGLNLDLVIVRYLVERPRFGHKNDLIASKKNVWRFAELFFEYSLFGSESEIELCYLLD